jgi:hypothetical protein
VVVAVVAGRIDPSCEAAIGTVCRGIGGPGSPGIGECMACELGGWSRDSEVLPLAAPQLVEPVLHHAITPIWEGTGGLDPSAAQLTI